MAFKSLNTFNKERFENFFLLGDDGQFADVVFLYKSFDDVLVADVHYIKSNEYSGYVHCCERGCPACSKGIRVQNKIFIPLYNIKENKIQFFDRSSRFAAQLQREVFSQFADPSEYVFRIYRHGVARSMDTTYEIVLLGRLKGTSYEKILADNGAVFPDYYSTICKEMSVEEMSRVLNSSSGAAGYSDQNSVNNYVVTPRPSVPDTKDIDISSLEDVTTEDEPIAPSAPLVTIDPISGSEREEDDVAPDFGDDDIASDSDVTF